MHWNLPVRSLLYLNYIFNLYSYVSIGGVILSTRCTETFSSHRPRLSIWGFSLWSEPNNPRVVIQPGIVPGQCWSFRGFDGYLVIQLSRKILPTAFTMEHIPKSLAPDGQIDSAPRNFTVYVRLYLRLFTVYLFS